MANKIDRSGLTIDLLIEELENVDSEKAKLKNTIKKVVKDFDELIKELKEEASGITDDNIIALYNNSIPPEMSTTDINVALRSSRKTMNAIVKQRVNDLKNLIENINDKNN